MIYLDGFSGYGGFRKGFEEAGWKFDKVYFSEIDKHAIANYKYNFPESEHVGSITNIPDIGKIDLFTFGWPCQDNSVAGNRKGQRSDTRSGLLFHAVDCIERFRPRNFVAENVEGLRTVNKGIDIIESIKLLTFLNDGLPQYDIEMQLLNSRWFLPHNRERLFFVGHLRGSGSRKIFPIEGRKEQDSEVKMENTFRTDIAPVFRVAMPEVTRREIQSCVSIRDLTPIECERAQGLPDNWTRFGIYKGEKKEIGDNQRYSLCGNGVSIPPIKEIAKRLIF